MGEGERIRVVIVDDHQIFRTGLRAELGSELEVVGEAATVDEALEVIAATLPDVVLLDVHLPGGDGGGPQSQRRQQQGQESAYMDLFHWYHLTDKPKR